MIGLSLMQVSCMSMPHHCRVTGGERYVELETESRTECSSLESYVRSMKETRIQDGECSFGEDASAFVRTVEISNETPRQLRASVHGTGVDVALASLVPAGRETRPGRATVCVFVSGYHPTTLRLEAVARSGESTFSTVGTASTPMVYEYGVVVGDDAQQTTVSAENSEARNAEERQLLAQLRNVAGGLARAHLEIARLRQELGSTRTSLDEERQMRRNADALVAQQMDLIQQLEGDLRAERSENARLRRMLDEANASLRSAIPADVVASIRGERVGGDELRWALGTFPDSMSQAARTPGLCNAILGSGVAAMPAILLGLAVTPQGFLAAVALEIIGAVAGVALEAVVRPVIDQVCR